MERHFHQLENGLTIIGEYSPQARSLAAGFFVRTGARDETPEINGVSHFLEHMMFKGTARRSPDDVNREFDEMGARYNAFTSEEATVYYGNVLPQFQERLLDLLADMMRPALRDEDFEMEKNVILEEIAMYQDRPQFLVFDKAREAYYQTHPLGFSILGSSESIRKLECAQMHEYFARRYAANNLSLVLTGNCDWAAVKAKAQELCGAWNTAETPRTLNAHAAHPKICVESNEKFNRAHIAMLAPGFSAQDGRRWAASVACEAIGADDGSRLYWELVHPGLAEAAHLGHDANDGDGAYYGYLLADPGRAQEVLEVFRHVVDDACERGISGEEVERAIRRLASHLVLGAESPMGRLRTVGMDWMYRREQKLPAESLENLLTVSVHDVNEALSMRPFSAACVVALGPAQMMIDSECE
jgi:predicted Zn-dependent peptidase